MYAITVDNENITWRAVTPSINIEKRRGILVPVATQWLPTGKSGSISKALWQAGISLEIEPGRSIILNQLLEEKQEAVVPAVIESLTKEFLTAIENKVGNQVALDGELLIMWPDILGGAKNWREYKVGSSPVGELDRRIQQGWERLWVEKNGFSITDADRNNFKKIREVGPYLISLSAPGGKLRRTKWLDYPAIELDQPMGFSFSDVVTEDNAIIYNLELKGVLWHVIPNGKPLGDFHSLLVSAKPEKQLIEYKDIMVLIEVTELSDSNFIYNSLWAGASVNSKHIQLIYGAIPGAEQAISGNYQHIMNHKNTIIGKSYMSNSLIIIGSDKTERIGLAYAFIDMLQKNNIPFNILAYKNLTIVVPRSNNDSKVLNNKPIGAIEPLGKLCFSTLEECHSYDAVTVGRAINEVTLNGKEFAKLVKEFKAHITSSPLGKDFGSLVRIYSANIRTGKHTFTWGRPAKESNILKLLGLTYKDLPAGDIADVNKANPENEPVGELWLASDDQTYPSKVVDSNFNLIQLLEREGERILGGEHISRYGKSMATIMKLIDAGQSLSVQVHPAMNHPTRPAKPEMWMVGEGGARLYLGFNQDITPEILKQAYDNGTLENLLYQLTAKEGELIIVDGALIHAIRKGTTIWEWSHAPTGEEIKKGDLKRATVAPWDRTDGKSPRKGKEDLTGTLEVLDDAVNRANIPAYNKLDLAKTYSQRKKLFNDNQGNRIDNLFTTSEVIVDEIILNNQISQQTNNHGYPIFILEGSVQINAPNYVPETLNTNDCAIIPAYLKNYTLTNTSNQPTKIIRWYAPVGSSPVSKEERRKIVLAFVSPEVNPFLPSGGLGDVLEGLPKALASLSNDELLVEPWVFTLGYDSIDYSKYGIQDIGKFCSVNVNGIEEGVDIALVEKQGVKNVFLRHKQWRVYNKKSYLGHNIKDYELVKDMDTATIGYIRPDHGQGMFLSQLSFNQVQFLNKGVLSALEALDVKPDVIIGNDWFTGMIPVLLKSHAYYKNMARFRNTAVAFIIHSLEHQGRFPKNFLPGSGIPWSEFKAIGGLEFYDSINLMKAGIVYSDVVITVSEGYKKDIMTPEFGFELDGVLRAKNAEERLFAILNGLDYELVNPMTDPNVGINYDSSNVLTVKPDNRRLFKECIRDGFKVRFDDVADADNPIIIFVGRIVTQKGIDIIPDAMRNILRNNPNAQCVLTGPGDRDAYGREIDGLEALQREYPGRAAVLITKRFMVSDEGVILGTKVYSGGDLCIIPSKYAPCELIDILCYKYGVIPVGRNVGGLADKIKEFNLETGEGSGFVFDNFSSWELELAIQRALNLRRDHRLVWDQLFVRNMGLDLSWGRAARKYLGLFELLHTSSSPIDSSIASYILTHTSVSKLEGRYLLDAFNELAQNSLLTPEISKAIAKAASEEFKKLFNKHDTDVLPDMSIAGVEVKNHHLEARVLAETLIRIGMYQDGAIAKTALGPIFAGVVEYLNDFLTVEARDIFSRFICQMITIAREYPECEEFSRKLSEFGLHTEADLLSYHNRIRKELTFKETTPRDQIKGIVVLPRMTIGAETAVNAAMINRILELYPNTTVYFIADKKIIPMLEGNPRVKVLVLKQASRRGAGLGSRLTAWLDILAQVREINPDYVFSADSRVDSQGLFPLVPAERYFYWENTIKRGEPMKTLATLVNEKMDKVFGLRQDGISVPTLYFTEVTTRFARTLKKKLNLAGRYVVAIKYDVGGEYSKSLGQEFNREHLKVVLSSNTIVIMDRGFDEEELKQSQELIDMAKESGVTVIEVTDKDGGLGRQVDALDAADVVGGKSVLIVFYGTIGGWVSLTGIANQAFSYDSVNQHVAAADKVFHGESVMPGTPVVIAFTGYHSEIFPVAWRPTGRNRVEAITTGMGKCEDWKGMLEKVLKAYKQIRQLQENRPLELLDIVAPNNVTIPNWPALNRDWEYASNETLTLIQLPYLVDVLFSGKHRFGLPMLYALAYLRTLPTSIRNNILKELVDLGYATLAKGLDTYYNRHLPEQIEWIKSIWVNTREKDLSLFVELRDNVILRSRGLRVGVETSDAVDQSVLEIISSNNVLLEVILGLRPMAAIEGLSDEQILRIKEALWAMRQVEGAIINIFKTAEGKVIAYDEYLLKKFAVLKGRTLAVTTQGLEHLINKDLVAKEGQFHELLQKEYNDSYAVLRAIARVIITIYPHDKFATWDGEVYRAGEISKKVFELRRPALEAEFLGTSMRTIALKNALIAELESQTIFNQRVPIVVIDGSDDKKVFYENKDNVSRISAQYDAEIILLSLDVFFEDLKNYAKHLANKYQAALDNNEEINPSVRRILEKYSILKEGKLDEAAMLNYVTRNAFFHISGLRNYTVLMGKGDRVIMNIDDDAPAETYIVKKAQREDIRKERLSLRNKYIKEMYRKASEILNIAINNELDFYRVLTQNPDNAQLQELENLYFAFNANENTALIPQAMGEVGALDQQYLDKDGLGNQLKLTHQRYQSLMEPLSKYMVTVSDFYYHCPRVEKKDNAFHVMPVNVLTPSRLIGKQLKDTDLLFMEKDLRGTMAQPVIDKERIASFQEQRIIYIPYPFILDQDASGLAQFIRYLQNPNKARTNLQHPDQAALIVDGVGGFAGDVNVIFNRAAFDNSIPTPTIGRDLRLEEPPYVVWISKPMRRGEVTVSYSKVAGGQQREIGERLYVISSQDFTEVAGGLSRALYEEAVRRFYKELAENKALNNPDDYMLRLVAIGDKYIEVAEEFKVKGLAGSQKDDLRYQQQIRAMLAAELGIQRAQKQAALATAKDKEDIERQIQDIDLILVQFSDDFYLYRTNNRKANDYGPQNKDRDYMYAITVDNENIAWKAVTPSINIEKRRGILVPVATQWLPTGKSGSISKALWQAGIPLEIEPGRSIILNQLPENNQEAIVPAIVESLTKEFLMAIENKVGNQVALDGELLIMWPDILGGAKNWREYKVGSSPVGEDKDNKIDTNPGLVNTNKFSLDHGTYNDKLLLADLVNSLSLQGLSEEKPVNQDVIAYLRERSPPSGNVYDKLIFYLERSQIVFVADDLGTKTHFPRANGNHNSGIRYFEIIKQNKEGLPAYFLHITKAYYEAYLRDNTEAQARLILHFYVERILAPPYNMTRHQLACQKEIVLIEPSKKGLYLDETRQSILDQAIAENNYIFLFNLIHNYDIRKDPDRIHLQAIYAALSQIEEKVGHFDIQAGKDLLSWHRYMLESDIRVRNNWKLTDIMLNISNIMRKGVEEGWIKKTLIYSNQSSDIYAGNYGEYHHEFFFPYSHENYNGNAIVFIPQCPIDLNSETFSWEELNNDKAFAEEIKSYVAINKLTIKEDIERALNEYLDEVRVIHGILEKAKDMVKTRRASGDNRAVLIGVLGPAGAGKTTFSDLLTLTANVMALKSGYAGCDGYLHPGTVKDPKMGEQNPRGFRFDLVKYPYGEYRNTYLWGPCIYNDTELWRVLNHLREGGKLIKSADLHAGKASEMVGPDLDILVSDGVFMGMDKELSNLVDIFVSIYVDTTEATRLQRKIGRDMNEGSTHKGTEIVLDFCEKQHHETKDGLKVLMEERADFIWLGAQRRLYARRSSSPVEEEIITRRKNIDLMRDILTSADYKGYDVIIISSSTDDEALYQQKLFEKAFGSKALVLSVVDDTNRGNHIGTLYTWLEAEKMAAAKGIDLRKLAQNNNVKVMMLHNGGKGERFSPIAQSLGNSRAAQKLVGTIAIEGEEEIDLELLLAVALQSSTFAQTNDAKRMEVAWTGQLIFGTNDFNQLRRSYSLFDQIVVGMDPTNVSIEELTDLGIIRMSPQDVPLKFYPAKTFLKKQADGKTLAVDQDNRLIKDSDALEGLAQSKDRFGYSLGTFSISFEMLFALLDYWQQDLNKLYQGLNDQVAKRDLDPDFVPCLVELIQEKIDFSVLDIPNNIKRLSLDERNNILQQAISTMEIKYPQIKKIRNYQEIVGLVILNLNHWKDINNLVGSADVGVNSHWLRYRRAIDTANEKLAMLYDLLGKVIKIDDDGSIKEEALTEENIILAQDSRRIRGITDDRVVQLSIEGKKIVLGLDQVRNGIEIGGVYIKNSIILNSDLKRGSRIINSVVNNSTGRFDVLYSYVESSIIGKLMAVNSFIHKAADAGLLTAEKEIIADIFRKNAKDPRFPEGQSRVRAPIYYDPKGVTTPGMSDNIKFGDNTYSLMELREDLECIRTENDKIESRLRDEVIRMITSSPVINVTLELPNIPYEQPVRRYNLELPKNVKDLRYYLTRHFYSRMIFVGPRKLTIEVDDPQLKKVLDEVRDILTNKDNQFKDKKPLLYRRAYHISQMLTRIHKILNEEDAFEFDNIQYNPNINKFKSSKIVPEQLTKKEIKEMLKSLKNLDIGYVYIGIDVGGTDVKLVAVKKDESGEIKTLYQEKIGSVEGWKPDSYTKASQYINIVVSAIDTISNKLPEEDRGKLRGIGISWPDMIINDLIVGGDSGKTAGLVKSKNPEHDWNREELSQNEYWKEFKRLSRLVRILVQSLMMVILLLSGQQLNLKRQISWV
ncbi:MAG: type I phosphomannose isomerase catalytic subunit [Candidatus Omnitrophota bacterium]